jgi:secreted trypsin-like serine protease
MRWSALPLLCALPACIATAPEVSAVDEPIIGGTNDNADPAVVLIYMTTAGQSGAALCTGEIVSPHVVLTAAHCAGGENPATAASSNWSIFLGTDFSQATASSLLPVREAHYDTAFDTNQLQNGHDIGVLVLQNPVSIAPMPLNRTALDPSFNAQPVRFVGYGLDNAVAQTGAGIKRQTTTTLTSFSDLLLNFSDGTHETCNGDSGGPALMTVNGKEVIVGITSFGDVNCNQGGSDTRIDTLSKFVDGYINANDPNFLPSAPTSPVTSAPPPPSGGSQPTPTSPVQMMPPSSSAAGAVGASCLTDNECQSHLCGLSDHGTHQCAAPNAAAGSLGCSVAAGRAETHGTSLALLIVGVGLALMRRRLG